MQPSLYGVMKWALSTDFQGALASLHESGTSERLALRMMLRQGNFPSAWRRSRSPWTLATLQCHIVNGQAMGQSISEGSLNL